MLIRPQYKMFFLSKKEISGCQGQEKRNRKWPVMGIVSLWDDKNVIKLDIRSVLQNLGNIQKKIWILHLFINFMGFKSYLIKKTFLNCMIFNICEARFYILYISTKKTYCTQIKYRSTYGNPAIFFLSI